jgi:macrolide transport system ATP-binding/permease protein
VTHPLTPQLSSTPVGPTSAGTSPVGRSTAGSVSTGPVSPGPVSPGPVSPGPVSIGTAHLRARGLKLARGGRIVLDGIDLTLAAGDRLAIVGENGRGKTTLLDALAGRLEPDAGTIDRHGSLGLVEQELPTTTARNQQDHRESPDHRDRRDPPTARTVGDLLDALLARPLAALAELDEAAQDLAEDTPAAARRYDDALSVATALDAWDAERRLEVALEEVGAIADRDRALASLSVGQRYRVRLAGVIAARDDIWLLDEPTNHLDSRGLDHLTRAALEHPGAVAVVSHDRALLGEVATGFLDLDPTQDGRPLLVSGDIDAWQDARRRARIAWEDAYRAQQEEHRRLAGAADDARSRLSTGWRPDKGTGKHQRQSHAPGVVRAVNQRIAELESHRLDVPPPPPRLHLPPSTTAPGTPLLRADGVALPPRLAETNLRLEGGDRLLVVGPNGAGKTTLLRILAGDLSPAVGAVRVLGGARIGLLAQEDRIPEFADSTPVVRDTAPGAGSAPAGQGSYARRYRGSPGERRRRELAALFRDGPDVLLLDEPTNHLGISGVDDLLTALATAPAAVVVASHDRAVLRALVDWPRLELG